jgi:Transcription factor IIIC subunit delta N-term
LHQRKASSDLLAHQPLQWDSERFQAALGRSDDEEHVDCNTFSLGEEQGPGHVHSLAWSSPGLAKFNRSMLAVLNTDHQLALYQSVRTSKTSKDRIPVLLVNGCLSAYFNMIEASSPKIAEKATLQLQRLRRRIRAFAWASNSFAQPNGALIEQERPAASDNFTRGFQLLVLANDNGEVVLIRVISPYMDSTKSEWSLDGITHFKAFPEPSTISNFPKVFVSNFVSNVALSPWVSSGEGSYEAALAYTTPGTIKIRILKIDGGSTIIDDIEHVIGDFALHHSQGGNVKWHWKVGRFIQMVRNKLSTNIESLTMAM